MRIEHLNPEGLHVNPAFTQAVVVEGPGRIVYVGGQNALSEAGEIVGSDLKTQTAQALLNVETALEAAGASLDDLVKWNIYVVQGHDLGEGFLAAQEFWGRRANPPAISVLVVAGLASPAFLVEIEAVAAVEAG